MAPDATTLHVRAALKQRGSGRLKRTYSGSRVCDAFSWLASSWRECMGLPAQSCDTRVGQHWTVTRILATLMLASLLGVACFALLSWCTIRCDAWNDSGCIGQLAALGMARFYRSDGLCMARPRAAFVYMVAEPYSTITFGDSLKGLFTNFNDQHGYPVYVFHDSSCSRDDLWSLLRTVLTEKAMQQVWFHHLPSPPSGLDLEASRRFWMYGLFSHEAIRDLDMIWHLDPSTVLLAPVEYDVFCFLKAHRKVYGYVDIEVMAATGGLWEGGMMYAAQENLTMREPPRGDGLMTCYQLGCEIIDVQEMHLPRMSYFLSFLLNAPTIDFRTDWHAGCVRFLNYQLLYEPEEVRHLCDVKLATNGQVHERTCDSPLRPASPSANRRRLLP
eukprot:jgi/Chlat1/1440/Chrsp12S01994